MQVNSTCDIHKLHQIIDKLASIIHNHARVLIFPSPKWYNCHINNLVHILN